MWSESKLQRFEAVEPHMGTLMGITLYARSIAEAKAAFTQAFARIAELNAKLSDYLADSEVNGISTEPRAVSRELYEILAFSQSLSERSAGAFDVTVGPVTRLWRQKKQPTAEALSRVGWRHLRVERGKVWFDRSGMQLDLGAIGKGYAGDEALAVLRRLGIPRAMIAASGDIVAGEAPPGESGWRVRAGKGVITVRDGAVSTSGDSEQYFIQDGKRYSHILDPRSGLSMTDVLQVSVAARRGMEADGLDTAVRVMGREAGAALLKHYPGARLLLV